MNERDAPSATNLTPTSALSETYTYDDIGNILSKSDFGVGSYQYGNATRSLRNAGPHAVLSVGSAWTYTYDANGNIVSDGQRTVGYDDQDRPTRVTLNGVTTIFRYSPDGDRYMQRKRSPPGQAARGSSDSTRRPAV